MRCSSGALTGDPLAFFAGQVAWGRDYQGLGALVSQQYSVLAHGGLSAYVGTPGYDVLNALGAVFALATVWPVARRLGLAYALFMLVNILPPLANGGLLSAGRFSAVLFPGVRLAGGGDSSHSTQWLDRELRGRCRRSMPRCSTRGGRCSEARVPLSARAARWRC